MEFPDKTLVKVMCSAAHCTLLSGRGEGRSTEKEGEVRSGEDISASASLGSELGWEQGLLNAEEGSRRALAPLPGATSP